MKNDKYKDAIPEAVLTQVYGQIEAVKTALEWEIDNLVCSLYNLTYDEVKVIETGLQYSYWFAEAYYGTIIYLLGSR
jgi:hypothetical protein